MNFRTAAGAGVMFTFASLAGASVNIFGGDQTRTISTLHGGDRELNRLGFLGSSTIMTGADFLRWDGGSLETAQSSSGWTTAIARDVEFANTYDANPDRADDASLYAGEAAGTGTLKEVFGAFSTGYKNMSWLVDGEDDKGYALSLLFPKGQTLQFDNNNTTVEISVLERNGNSDFRVQGILANGSIGPSVFISRAQTESTGWTLDSLEINGPQKVSAVGISVDSDWNGVVGIRILAIGDTDNGPDIVGVGTTVVPAPGALALVGAAGGMLIGRRRR